MDDDKKEESQAADAMTLRDYFAAQALIALMDKRDRAEPDFKTANNAYAMADAMLRERRKRRE